MKATYIVNVWGTRAKSEAESFGFKAYCSDHTNITAIEIPAKNKAEARRVAEKYWRVLFVYL